jgi:thioredoxin reductase
MKQFEKQAKRLGVNFKLTDVKKVSFGPEGHQVETFRNIFSAKSVIIATGGKLNLPAIAYTKDGKIVDLDNDLSKDVVVKKLLELV